MVGNSLQAGVRVRPRSGPFEGLSGTLVRYVNRRIVYVKFSEGTFPISVYQLTKINVRWR